MRQLRRGKCCSILDLEAAFYEGCSSFGRACLISSSVITVPRCGLLGEQSRVVIVLNVFLCP